MTEPTEPAAPAAPANDRPCPQGHECAGRYATEEPVYTTRDYLWMLVGVSSRKVPVRTKCALCNHVWEVSEPRRPW